MGTKADISTRFGAASFGLISIIVHMDQPVDPDQGRAAMDKYVTSPQASIEEENE